MTNIPVYVFNTTTDTGIDEIPVNGLIIIKDDGSGQLRLGVKKDMSTFDENSTVADLMNASGAFGESSTSSLALESLSNVTISSIADGQSIKWDDANSIWVNYTPSGGGGGGSVDYLKDIGNVDISSISNGQMIKWDSANSKWINFTLPNQSTTVTDLIDTDISSIQDAQILRWNNANSVWENVTLSISSNDLSDIDTTTTAPANGNLLRFDGTNWVPSGETIISINTKTGTVILGTDDIGEGSTNLYYTNARVDARIQATAIGSLSDVDMTTTAPVNGNIARFDGANWVPVIETITSVNTKTGDVSLSTDDITEGSNNLYHTDTRVDNRISTASINKLSDVDTATTAPANGDALKFDGTNWIPGSVDVSISTNDLTDVDTATTAPNIDDILSFDGVNWVPVFNNGEQSQIQDISENGNNGWRIKGEDPANHGDIGDKAVDLSIQSAASDVNGATGDNAFAVGLNSAAHGRNSVALGQHTRAIGIGCVADGYNTWSFGGQPQDVASVDTNNNEITFVNDLPDGIDQGLAIIDFSNRQFFWEWPSDILNVDGPNKKVTVAHDMSTVGNDFAIYTFHEDGTGFAHAINQLSRAYGKNAFASGLDTEAIGENSFSGGAYTRSKANQTFSFGWDAYAVGDTATAFGTRTEANGDTSFVAGYECYANGVQTFAAGYQTNAMGDYSAAIGQGTQASSMSMLAVGQYNLDEQDTLFEVGMGLDDSTRDNAIRVSSDGKLQLPKADPQDFQTDGSMAINFDTLQSDIFNDLLPNSDPGQYGTLYVDNGILKVSQ